MAVVVVACGSSGDGARGETGLGGQPGPQGPAGVPGPSGVADGGSILTGACTQPCHTFGGVVDQWRFSNHSHPQENLIGGGACGNCHGIDGIAQRVANKYTIPADAAAPVGVPSGHINYKNGAAISEIGYGGATTVGLIHCTTCHDFNPTNDPHVVGKYVAGTAPLRVKGGASDTVLIEKSPLLSSTTGQSVAYKAANICVMCHKSRKDVTSYITAANTISSIRWGPHEGPQTDVFSGKGGYQFAGLTYGTSAHAAIGNACVACHMSPVAGNANVPDHTMKPNVAYCKTCHTSYTGTNFDVQGGRTLVSNALSELEVALNDAGLLTRAQAAPYGPLSEEDLADGQFNLDGTRPGGNAGANITLDAPSAGALYNYLIIARSKDLGVHNPTYTKQLLWDSIRQLKGVDPTTLPSRPQ
ncbi:hypothetical protein BH11MYX4_BH11MYX4_57510 [soil metagenome]